MPQYGLQIKLNMKPPLKYCNSLESLINLNARQNKWHVNNTSLMTYYYLLTYLLTCVCHQQLPTDEVNVMLSYRQYLFIQSAMRTPINFWGTYHREKYGKVWWSITLFTIIVLIYMESFFILDWHLFTVISSEIILVFNSIITLVVRVSPQPLQSLNFCSFKVDTELINCNVTSYRRVFSVDVIC